MTDDRPERATHWYDDPKANLGPEKNFRQAGVVMGAEYRYVPHQTVVQPAPVQAKHPVYPLSFARPIPGGLSGRVDFELTAETAVLFGAGGEEATFQGEIRTITEHARLAGPLSPYVAPGRAIKGLLRSVYGIATASHFRPVNGDDRFSSRHMEYIRRFRRGAIPRGRNPPRAGWLQVDLIDGDLRWRLVPEEFTNFFYHAIVDFLAETNNYGLLERHRDGDSIGRKSEYSDIRFYYLDILRNLSFPQRSAFYGELAGLNQSVFVGQYDSKDDATSICIGGPQQNHHVMAAGPMETRLHEVALALPDESSSEIDLSSDDIHAFLCSHSDYAPEGVLYRKGDETRRAPKGHLRNLLADYLSTRGETGVAIARRLGLAKNARDLASLSLRGAVPWGVPVHFVELPTAKSIHIGPSQMIPVPPSGPVRDFVHQTGLPNGLLDWADALFGCVDDRRFEDDKNDDEWSPKVARNPALASRLTVHFAEATAVEFLKDGEALATLQGQPKVSFDPLTLSKRNGYHKEPVSWAAPTEHTIVNGYRRYPAVRPEDLALRRAVVRIEDGVIPKETATGEELTKSHSFTRPLGKGTTYRCRIDFHNLHPLELGGLLWAITFGDPSALAGAADGSRTPFRHVAGRLRNKGLGRLRPGQVQLDALVENPMPESLQWQASVRSDGDPRHALARILMQAFEAEMGRRFRPDEVLDDTQARRSFYADETISALLNTSDSAWTGVDRGHVPTAEKGGMFYLPRPKTKNSQTGKSEPDKEYFGNFSNLRALLYNKQLPRTGSRTVLDEFLKPVRQPTGLVDVPSGVSALERFSDPAAELTRLRRAGKTA